MPSFSVFSRLRGTLNGCGHLEQDWRILGLEEIVGQGGEGFWLKERQGIRILRFGDTERAYSR